MSRTLKTSRNQTQRARLLSIAGLAATFIALPVLAPAPAHAQGRPGPETFSCQSLDGQRKFCRADMSRGPLQMNRQLGDVRCIEGENWGYQDGGIWVDRGCRAEFMFAPPPPQAQPDLRPSRIEPGTVIPIMTNERISASRADGRVFTGSVNQDVQDRDGRVAIPRGSSVELVVRVAHDNDLILDLDSVTVNGQRYGINAGAERFDAGKETVGANERTGRYVGGGAILGAIMGAAIGGGKGAAIGAGVGAAGGATAEIATSGREVRIPAESVVTFRIDRPLMVDVPDDGFDRDGNHFHRFDGDGR